VTILKYGYPPKPEDDIKSLEYLNRLGFHYLEREALGRQHAENLKKNLKTYKQALADNGIECEESLVVHMPAKGQVYTMKNGYDQTMKLLQSGAKFTAIYAISDTLAIGACKAIFDYGLRVPDDISVVGCDGLDMARYYQPAITTIEQPLSAMALETSRILFELIREKGGKKKHIFEARIREGQSVRRI
jgi:LacI family transcriptional regulator